MTLRNAFYLTILSFFFFTTSFAQGPPPMAMPTDSSTVVIDKIIEATGHEAYFVDYCSKKVNDYAVKNNWSPKKTKQISESVRFSDYKSTIYNSYAFYSIDQLETLLETITMINKDSKGISKMILTNSMMQSNLDLHVNGVIEGKYVTSKQN